MRDNGLRAKAAKKYKATTNSKHSLPVAPNLLQQDFTANAPDQKWVSDITYIWTDEGWLYLAVVLELYSRRVIGWAISGRMTATLVCDALMIPTGHKWRYTHGAFMTFRLQVAASHANWRDRPF